MFGLWYIVFGVAFIAIMALLGIILVSKLCDKKYALDRGYEHRYHCEVANTVFVSTLIISCFVLIILIIVSIIAPIGAKREVRAYEYNKELIEISLETVQGDSGYLAITGDIFEYNKWLADVKSRVATFGRFSVYYGLVEDLEPIRLPTKTAD